MLFSLIGALEWKQREEAGALRASSAFFSFSLSFFFLLQASAGKQRFGTETLLLQGSI